MNQQELKSYLESLLDSDEKCEKARKLLKEYGWGNNVWTVEDLKNYCMCDECIEKRIKRKKNAK